MEPQQHDLGDGLPAYSKDDLKSPLVQEKWADIEATLPPYELPKRRSKKRVFARKDWVRVASIAFVVFICIIVPAVVVGVVFGLRSPHTNAVAAQPTQTPVQQNNSTTNAGPSDGAIATGTDGQPIHFTAPSGPGATAPPPPSPAPTSDPEAKGPRPPFTPGGEQQTDPDAEAPGP